MRAALLLGLVVMIVALTGADAASAQPTPPARFHGEVILFERLAPRGTVITARIGGVVCGTTEVFETGRYAIDVASGSTRFGCGFNGARVTFTVGGTPAGQTGVFRAGAFIPLDLIAPDGPIPPPPPGNRVTYPAGWNIVAGPTGMTFPRVDGSLFTLQAGDRSYQVISPRAGVRAGLGYWAFFTSPVTVELRGTPERFVQVRAPAGQWVMIGNPGFDLSTGTVSGADLVFVYDPARGTYVETTVLQPGQGAWAITYRGGVISVGFGPPPPP